MVTLDTNGSEANGDEVNMEADNTAKEEDAFDLSGLPKGFARKFGFIGMLICMGILLVFYGYVTGYSQGRGYMEEYKDAYMARYCMCSVVRDSGWGNQIYTNFSLNTGGNGTQQKN